VEKTKLRNCEKAAALTFVAREGFYFIRTDEILANYDFDASLSLAILARNRGNRNFTLLAAITVHRTRRIPGRRTLAEGPALYLRVRVSPFLSFQTDSPQIAFPLYLLKSSLAFFLTQRDPPVTIASRFDD
jgi:hypothetical protein